MGLSRAPVRDALARLADEGLVETKPQSYTRVTPLVLLLNPPRSVVSDQVEQLLSRRPKCSALACRWASSCGTGRPSASIWRDRTPTGGWGESGGCPGKP